MMSQCLAHDPFIAFAFEDLFLRVDACAGDFVDEHPCFAEQDGLFFILDLELGGFAAESCNEDAHLFDVGTKVRPDGNGGLGKVLALKQFADDLHGT